MKKQTKFYKPESVELNPAILHYGKEKPYDGKETDFQKASAGLIAHLNIPLAYHIPNESRRPDKAGDIERMMNRAQGVKPGVADWCVPYKTNAGHPGSYIELKAKGGKLSQDQIKFLNGAFEQGYFCAVVWNLDSFEGLLKELYKKQRFEKPIEKMSLTEFIGCLEDAPGTFENDLKMLSK
jgi:VRR-NUC domain